MTKKNKTLMTIIQVTKKKRYGKYNYKHHNRKEISCTNEMSLIMYFQNNTNITNDQNTAVFTNLWGTTHCWSQGVL